MKGDVQLLDGTMSCFISVLAPYMHAFQPWDRIPYYGLHSVEIVLSCWVIFSMEEDL